MAQQHLFHATAADGARIAFHDSGRGQVLLIPGFGPMETIEQTTRFAPAARWYAALAEEARVVRVDLRGVGHSRGDGVALDFSQRAWTADVTAVIEALGVNEVTLFSVGGLAAYAVALAADQPERVRRLILTNPQDRLVGRDSTVFLLASQQLARADPDLGVASAVRHFLGPEPEREHYVGLVASELVGMRLDEATDAAMANVVDVTSRLPHVRAATLIIKRPGFASVTPGSEQRLASGIEGARFVSIPGEGLFPWTGDRDRVLDAIRAFLRETG